MTLPSFVDALKGEGCRLEFVVSFEGLPFAIATSQRVCDMIMASPSTLREIFGANMYITMIGEAPYQTYPADDCLVFPGLRGGPQTSVTSEPARPLDVASCRVEIDNLDNPIDLSAWLPTSAYTHGFPTLNYQFHHRVSDAVKWGSLHTTVAKDDTSIFLYDHGGIGDFVTANAPCFLWVGKECVRVTSVEDPDEGNKVIELRTTDTKRRGLFRSIPCSHYTKQYDAFNALVSNAPIGGITGRHCYYWAIVVSVEDDEIGDVVLLHHGAAMNDVRVDERVISFSIDGWVNQLDQPFRYNQFTGQLAKYVLSRGNEGTDIESNIANGITQAAPHLLICEWDRTNDEWRNTCIWLCERNSSVTFDSFDALLWALQIELSKCNPDSEANGSDATQLSGDDTSGNPRQYTIDRYTLGKYGLHHKVEISFEGTAPVVWSYIGGQLPIPMNFGQALTAEDGGSTNQALILGCIQQCLSPWNQLEAYAIRKNELERRDGRDDPKFDFLIAPIHDVAGTFTDANENIAGPRAKWKDGATRYYYGVQRTYDNTNDGVTSLGVGYAYSTPALRKFAWPLDSEDEAPYLWFCGDWDLNAATSEDRVALGSSKIFGSKSETSSEDDNSASKAFALCATGKLLYVPVELGDGFSRLTLSDAVSTVGGNACVQSMSGFAIFSLVPCLYYMPLLQDSDPWRVATAYDTEPTNKLSDIFRAMFGEETSVFIPRSCRNDGIIGAVETDFMDSVIDWDSFDETVVPFTSDQFYKIPYTALANSTDNKLKNILEIINSELLIHGVQMTYEYDSTATPKMWRIRFKRWNEVNLTEAISENRYLTSNDIAQGDVAKMGHSFSWIYNGLDVKLNYDGKEFYAALSSNTEDAIETIGGSDRRLSVESKLSHIPSFVQYEKNREVFELINRQLSEALIRRVSEPMFFSESEATIRCAASLAVGREAIVTDDTVIDPYTGARGLSNRAAIINSLSVDWNGIGGVVKYSIAPGTVRGIVPAALSTSATVEVSDWGPSTVVECEFEPNEFVPSSTGRVDISFFDCLAYSKAIGRYVDLDCDCSDYSCLAIELGNPVSAKTKCVVSDVVPASNSATVSANPVSLSLVPSFAVLGYDGTRSNAQTRGNCSASSSRIYWGHSEGLSYYTGTVTQLLSDDPVVSCSARGTRCFMATSYGDVRQYDEQAATTSMIAEGADAISVAYMGGDICLFTNGISVYRWDGDDYPNVGAPSGEDPLFLFCDGSNCYCACEDEIYVYGGGTTWTSLAFNTATGGAVIIDAIVDSDGDIAALAYDSTTGTTRVYTYVVLDDEWTDTGTFDDVDDPAGEPIGSSIIEYNSMYIVTSPTLGSVPRLAYCTKNSSQWAFLSDSLSVTLGPGVALNDLVVFSQVSSGTTHAAYLLSGFETEYPLVLKFGSSNDDDVQACQRDFWQYYSDENNQVLDGNDVARLGDKVG